MTMYEAIINEEFPTGYDSAVYSFVCPMCELTAGKIIDLSRTYVREETWRHLIARHRVVPGKLSIVVVTKDVLEGMEKTNG